MVMSLGEIIVGQAISSSDTMKNLRITVRLEKADRKKIEKLIKNGEFRSLSDFLRHAANKLLEVKNYASE